MDKKIFLFFCILSMIMPSISVYADNVNPPDVQIINEVLHFETRSTKASTGTRWKTVGFTITRDKTYGNPNTTNKKEAIYLLPKWKEKDIDNGDGTVTTKFKVPRENLSDALKGAGYEEIKPGDTIYLNGIFRITEGGNEVPNEEYTTLSGITGARWWNSTKEFPQFFDIEASWDPAEDNPVSIEDQLYKSSGTSVIESKDLGKHPTLNKYKTDSNLLPDTKTVGGETYNLYRVYYIENIKPNKKLDDRKTSINPNIFPGNYKEDLKFVRNRTFLVMPKGIKIVAMYRKFSNKTDTSGSEKIEEGFNEVQPSGTIAADTRGYEQFDVEDGIPTTETLYTNVISEDMIAGYTFIRKYGTKVYTVKVIKPVTIIYEVDDPNHKPKSGEAQKKIEMKESRNIVKTYQVEREFSYWMID